MSDMPADVAEIVQAAREHARPHILAPLTETVAAFVVPRGASLETVKPDDSRREAPLHLRGHVTLGDVASFSAYVAEFYEENLATTWVDAERFRVDALLNDASGEFGAAWRDHRATLQLVKTPEWTRWRQWDGKLMSQESFARHIEIAELDIIEPSAADLLEIASFFYATTQLDVRSGHRTQNGEVQLEWVETTEAKAGKKREMAIPKEFKLRIAPFHGEDTQEVRALLRYRIKEGLQLGYELVRPDDIERIAMNAIADVLRDKIRRVYIGSPAAAGR